LKYAIFSKRAYQIIFVLYFLFLIYVLFFGFNRSLFSPSYGYRFNIVPDRIPLWWPQQYSFDILKLRIIDLGNLLVFVPFGFILPILASNKLKRFWPFMGVFFTFIFAVELTQMLTYRGSFDILDIILNCFGAAIGFLGYIAVRNERSALKKIVRLFVVIVGCTILMHIFAAGYNEIFTPLLEPYVMKQYK
jgi:glycopeptide antibiotics resistance protein